MKKRYEVLYYENGKLMAIGDYATYEEFRNYTEKYPLQKCWTYEVIDHFKGICNTWPKEKLTG